MVTILLHFLLLFEKKIILIYNIQKIEKNIIYLIKRLFTHTYIKQMFLARPIAGNSPQLICLWGRFSINGIQAAGIQGQFSTNGKSM